MSYHFIQCIHTGMICCLPVRLLKTYTPHDRVDGNALRGFPFHYGRGLASLSSATMSVTRNPATGRFRFARIPPLVFLVERQATREWEERTLVGKMRDGICTRYGQEGWSKVLYATGGFLHVLR